MLYCRCNAFNIEMNELRNGRETCDPVLSCCCTLGPLSSMDIRVLRVGVPNFPDNLVESYRNEIEPTRKFLV